MARTYRDSLTVIKRNAWAFSDNLPVGAHAAQFGVGTEIRNFQRTKGGNMVMSPSRCGVWDDMRADSSTGRKRQRRQYKRIERRNWFANELHSETSN